MTKRKSRNLTVSAVSQSPVPIAVSSVSTTNSGTKATFGTTCVAIMKGLSVSSIQRTRPMTMPIM